MIFDCFVLVLLIVVLLALVLGDVVGVAGSCFVLSSCGLMMHVPHVFLC